MRSRRSAGQLAALVVLLAACGGAGEADSATTEPAPTVAAPSTTGEAPVAAETTTAAPATTTTTTTTTTAAPSVCPALPDLPTDVVAASRYDAGDGRFVDVVEVTSAGNQTVTDTTIRLTYADGGAVELARSQVNIAVIGFFDTNGDGSDELFLLDELEMQRRLWIVTDADCELTIADSPRAPLGAPIFGGGEALLLADLDTNDVGAGVACADGRIRTHYFFVDPSPSAAGMVNLDVNEAELEGSELVVVASERPKVPVEEAAALPLLDCGDLALPEAG